MFFGLSLPDILTLLGLGVLLVGPDKLPHAVTTAARFLRQVRDFSDNATSELRKELGPEFDGLNLADLNPRTFVRNNLLGESEQLRELRDELNLHFRNPLDESPAPRKALDNALQPTGGRTADHDDIT
jgi:sec-independent protein translocase protein TatB